MTWPSDVQIFLTPYFFRDSPNNCIREDVKLSVINNRLLFNFFLFITSFYSFFFLDFPVYDFCLDQLPWFWHLALQKMFLLRFHWCSRRSFYRHYVKPDNFVVSTAPNRLCQTKGFLFFLLNFQWFFLIHQSFHLFFNFLFEDRQAFLT